MSSELTQAELKHALDYDPQTGRFTWLNPTCRRLKPGAPAGYQKNGGYWAIRLKGRKYFAHRLAWLYVHGKFPSIQIDHINRDPSDNRIENLRDVTHSVNMRNRSCSRCYSSGHRVGVRQQGKKWQAYHYVNKRYVHIGTFSTAEEAAIARRKAS